MTRDGRIFAVICKTGGCGAKIPLLAEVRSIFPKAVLNYKSSARLDTGMITQKPM